MCLNVTKRRSTRRLPARPAPAGADLLVAHKAYVDLRMAAREVIRAAGSEFPEEGLVFYTNPRITGDVWNVNVVGTSRTNIPAH